MTEERRAAHYVGEAMKDAIGGAVGGFIAFMSMGETTTEMTSFFGAILILLLAALFWFADNHIGTVMYWSEGLFREERDLGTDSARPDTYRPKYRPNSATDSTED